MSKPIGTLFIKISVLLLSIYSFTIIFKFFSSQLFNYHVLSFLCASIFIYTIIFYMVLSKIKTYHQNLIIGKKVKDMENTIVKYYSQKRNLETAKLDAEEAAKSKDIFLQNMSHEIRTPLNGIINMTELLKYTSLNPKQQYYTDTIVCTSKILLDIINNILDYSKIQAKNLHILTEESSISEILLDLKSFFSSSVNSSIFIFFSVSKTVPDQIIMDKFRIKQILINLIGNGIKFTKSGFVSLDIDFNSTTSPESILFTIKDSGIGIPKEKLSTIFESFMQVDESISRRYGGTGLGLSITRQVVKAMEGEIKVESRLDIGTTFTVNIPIYKNNSAIKKAFDYNGENIIILNNINTLSNLLLKNLSEYNLITYLCTTEDDLVSVLEEIKNEQVAIITTTESLPILKPLLNKYNFLANKIINLGSISSNNDFMSSNITYLTFPIIDFEILDLLTSIFTCGTSICPYMKPITQEIIPLNIRAVLIEDNVINAKAMKEMLEIIGVTVTLFENGLDAIKNIKEENYDVILSDIQLPDLSGFEVLNLIRDFDIKNNRHTNIIAITAHALPGYSQKCIDAGFDSYLSKPVTISQLYESISKIVKLNLTLNDNSSEILDSKRNIIFKKLESELIYSASASISKIEKAILIFDFTIIEFESHKLKGSFGNAKEEELYNIFQKLESVSKLKDISSVKRVFNECNKIFYARFNK